MHGALRLSPLFGSTLALLTLSAGSTAAADLSSPQPQAVPNAISSGWEFRSRLTFGAVVLGEMPPSKVVLSMSRLTLPMFFGSLKFAVMGDLGARKGPFSLMVDGFYGNQ